MHSGFSTTTDYFINIVLVAFPLYCAVIIYHHSCKSISKCDINFSYFILMVLSCIGRCLASCPKLVVVLAIVFILSVFAIMLQIQINNERRKDCLRNMYMFSNDFVGHKEDIKKLTEMLAFNEVNAERRIINIYGPPSFGTSTLAHHVAFELCVHEGVQLHSIDYLEESDPLKKLADIMEEHKEDSKRPKTLIILDNCDTFNDHAFSCVLKKFRGSNRNLKIILTRHVDIDITDNQHNVPYGPTSELNISDSIQLLEKTHVADQLTLEQKRDIAILTGNNPHALILIRGSLHKAGPMSDPSKIISRLREKPINRRLEVSIKSSLGCLKKDLVVVVNYLTLFPTSFSSDSAFQLVEFLPSSYADVDHLKSSLSLDSLNELVLRTLIRYNRQTRRYSFHRQIKHYVLTEMKNRAIQNETFWDAFRYHYALKLNNVLRHKESHALLTTEKANFRFLFLHLLTSELIDESFVKTLAVFVDGHFNRDLNYLLSVEELYEPFQEILKCVDRNIRLWNSYSQTKFVETMNGEILSVDYFNFRLYIRLVVTVGNIVSKRDIEKAVNVYVVREKQVIQLKPNRGTTELTQLYRMFYYEFGELSLKAENLAQFMRCHSVITNSTERCVQQSEPCKLKDLGDTYMLLSKVESTKHLYELSLKFDDIQPMERLSVLIELHYIYSLMSDLNNIENILKKLEDALSMDLGSYALSNENFSIIMRALSLFINMPIHELNIEDVEDDFFSTLKQSGFELKPNQVHIVTEYFFKKGDYSNVAAWGLNHSARLDCDSKSDLEGHNIAILIKTHLLISKSLYYDGYPYFERMKEIVDFIQCLDKPDMYVVEQQDACIYLTTSLRYIHMCYLSGLWDYAMSKTFLRLPETIVYYTFVLPFDIYPRWRIRKDDPVTMYRESKSLIPKHPSALTLSIDQIENKPKFVEQLKYFLVTILHNPALRFAIAVSSILVREGLLLLVVHFLLGVYLRTVTFFGTRPIVMCSISASLCLIGLKAVTPFLIICLLLVAYLIVSDLNSFSRLHQAWYVRYLNYIVALHQHSLLLVFKTTYSNSLDLIECVTKLFKDYLPFDKEIPCLITTRCLSFLRAELQTQYVVVQQERKSNVKRREFAWLG